MGYTTKSCTKGLGAFGSSALFKALCFVAAGVLVGSLSNFFLVSLSLADYIAPGAVTVKTNPYTPVEKDFPKGKYSYSVTWQGIPVAKAEIEVAPDGAKATNPGFMAVEARARSGGIVKLFYNLRHLSRSEFNADSFRPSSFYSEQSENSKFATRDVKFKDDGEISAKLKKEGREAEEINFNSENFTFDPISAAFMARSLPIEIGTKKSFDVFNGKHRFLITLEVVKRETIRIQGQRRDAFKVQPTIVKLTDTEGEKKLKSATLWVSADKNRDVLKIKSEVMIGSVTAELRSFEPAATPTKTPVLVRTAKVGNPSPAPKF